MPFVSKYNLELIPVGESRYYDDLDALTIKRIRRAAMNFNARGRLHFRTKMEGDVLAIKRVR